LNSPGVPSLSFLAQQNNRPWKLFFSVTFAAVGFAGVVCDVGAAPAVVVGGVGESVSVAISACFASEVAGEGVPPKVNGVGSAAALAPKEKGEDEAGAGDGLVGLAVAGASIACFASEVPAAGEPNVKAGVLTSEGLPKLKAGVLSAEGAPNENPDILNRCLPGILCWLFLQRKETGPHTQQRDVREKREWCEW
jgi:hypothetical protein